MTDRLAVVVLGTRDAGKTTTWKTLFGRPVKTGEKPRKLWFGDSEWVEVFLVSGSHQERGMRIEQVVREPLPRILLCSVQYKGDAQEAFTFLQKNRYSLFVTRLNPGYGEPGPLPDSLGLGSSLVEQGATFQARSGKADPVVRTQEMLEFIYGWARGHGLVMNDEGVLPKIAPQVR